MTTNIQTMNFLILAILVILEVFLSPRLGFTTGGKVLLWYGKRNRKYLILF